MKNIYDVLKDKESEYAGLIAQYRRMNEAVNKVGRELEAIRTTVKLLADSQDQTPDENKELSQPQMLRAVLAEHGAEMHLSEILKGVEKKFKKKLSANVTAAVIFRYAKRGSIFYKSESKPNTWGLLEFRGEEKPTSFIENALKVVA